MASATAEKLIANVTEFSPIADSWDALRQYCDSYADCKVLLLGDASHGTSEFYATRAEITKHMIQHHGFNIVAVEADWPDAEAVDRYVRHRQEPGPKGRVEPQEQAKESGRNTVFKRFPTWMWRNREVQDFVDWMREYNKDLHVKDAAGFYGLDLYSMAESMEAVIDYLDTVDAKMADVSRERYDKLMDWAEDPHEYGLESLMAGFKGYEKEVVDMLRDLLRKRLEYSAAKSDGVEFHGGEQNARVVADAERYYKAMYHGRDESWNLRDTHMFQTLLRILKHRGDNSKAIVWAHNSHVGDARATDMGQSRDEINIGQLCKETFNDQALVIGTGTYTGTVAAAKRWGADMKIMRVRPGLPNSYETLMHSTGVKNFLLDLRKGRCDRQLRDELSRPCIQRFIGVIYRPETERQSHYSAAVLPEQFDGFIWLDETKHVGPLEVHQPGGPVEYDETWPFGL